MESSFFEYRDKTGAESGSDEEVIDSSMVQEKSFCFKTKPTGKNHTVFVAESEESTTDDEEEPSVPKISVTRSSPADTRVSSSDDDNGSRRGSHRQPQLEMSFNNVVLSSSEEEQGSPELLPKRRPPTRPKSSDSDKSIIGRKFKKRVFLDSDTDNSIIIEHNKQNKLKCLKDTPLKIDTGKNELRKSVLDQSIDQNMSDDEENDGSEEESDKENQSADARHRRRSKNELRKSVLDQSIDKNMSDDEENDGSEEESDKGNQSADARHRRRIKKKNNVIFDDTDSESEKDDAKDDSYNKSNSEEISKANNEESNKDSEEEKRESSDEHESGRGNKDEESDGPDEDEMVMSRATRMSIMGVIPKGINDEDSDESDFILSDEKSTASSANSLSDLPDVTIDKKQAEDADTSKITCSPFGSPLHDITNELNLIEDSYEKQSNKKQSELKNKVLSNIQKNLEAASKLDGNKSLTNERKESQPPEKAHLMTHTVKVAAKENREKVIDDDVTIIDTAPEVIALSSDDDTDEVTWVATNKKSPTIKKSPSFKKSPEAQAVSSKNDGTMKQYLLPPSYPNQVIYVTKEVREKELAKLEGMKEDLRNVKYLLENMELESLPDQGRRLIERLSGLEGAVRELGHRVANMIVEQAGVSQSLAAEGPARGGSQQPSWDELQKASHEVQPRMFGKQAMSTHMAERNMILQRLKDLHESLDSRPLESKLATAPKAMKTTMMQHQLHALEWLRWRETQRPCGGILADDMGLGKTITMISLVVGDKDARIDEEDDGEEARTYSKLAKGGTLVVCPASLIQQWSGEVSKHCLPHAASVCLHHGTQRATQPHRLATYDIVVTTYNILQRDNLQYGVLMKILWRRIILDEAHIVRNHKSATSTAVCALKGKRRWCLTGTPVQNKDLDLFALLKFLRCTPFDDLQMWKKWIDNKSLGGRERMSTIMQCVLLRRTKQQLQQRGQLACLPTREASSIHITLAKQEMDVYQKVLVFSKKLFAQFLRQRAEKNSTGAALPPLGADSEYHKMHKTMIALQGAKPVKSHEILVLLLRLRQVCCHCGLIAAMLDDAADDPDGVKDAGSEELLAELNKLTLEDSKKSGQKEDDDEDGPEEEGTTVTEAIRSVLSPNNPVFDLSVQSSKIQAVMKCLKEKVFVNKGDKAVVVSQWTSVLRLVETQLQAAKVKCVSLTGNVPVPARPPLISALNDPTSDVKIMLLSLCAGGVGLNLCGANHLLLLDPHWNPQLEEQAQDRVYRVGQTKPVYIYRFMCVDTVEQSIRKLQVSKLELAENVLTGARNNTASKLTIEDLKMLFNMGNS